MEFRLAYPRRLTLGPPHPAGTDITAFYDLLTDCLRARGHRLTLYPDATLPPEDPDAVTLGYHSIGRRPRTWHIKRSYLLGTFSFDRDGYAGWSEMARSEALFRASEAEDEDDARAFVTRTRAASLAGSLSRWPQTDGVFQDDGRPFVFLPLQIETDTVMQLSRIDFATFTRGVTAALEGSGYTLVIKRHPGCTSPRVFRLLSELAARPHVRVTRAGVGGILARAAAVVCINSAVGFEALFHGCPVVTAGIADYGWVTTPVADAADLANLPRLIDRRQDPGRVCRFLSHFCRRYVIGDSDREAMMRRLAIVEAEAETDASGPAPGRSMPT